MAQLSVKAANLAKQVLTVAKPQAEVIWRYAKVELAPPKVSDIPAIRSGLAKLVHSAKTGGYKNLTVKEAWVNTLIGIEIWCWFFVGECIGKRHLVGYDV